MITKLSGDELTAAITHLVNNYNPHRVGYQELASALSELLTPLTHEGLKVDHLKTILELAEDWRDCDQEANTPFAAMEENAGAYRRHTAKAYQRLRVACMAVCEGGTP